MFYGRSRLVALATLSIVISVLILTAVSAVSGDIAALKAKYRRPADIPFPKDNPYTPEKAALGKALYFDPRLSGHQNMNCASCHNPSFGWEVPLKGAIGSQNTMLARNAPTILNQAWGDKHYFWDGRAPTLEQQARGPIEADVEMNLSLKDAVKRLKDIPEYRKWFDMAFPGEGVTDETITRAIATFERTVVSGYAPFDAWIDGEENAISASAKRGFALFTGKANCASCHSGWNFTDNNFHDIGVDTTDIGRGKYAADDKTARHAFKTPSLRDITQRAPFMHNGSMPDLDSVMAHYMSGGLPRESLSPQMKPLPLTVDDMTDVVEFMKTLTGTKQIVSLPVLPN
jgi:cytochrome c peroxidase